MRELERQTGDRGVLAGGSFRVACAIAGNSGPDFRLFQPLL